MRLLQRHLRCDPNYYPLTLLFRRWDGVHIHDTLTHTGGTHEEYREEDGYSGEREVEELVVVVEEVMQHTHHLGCRLTPPL